MLSQSVDNKKDQTVTSAFPKVVAFGMLLMKCVDWTMPRRTMNRAAHILCIITIAATGVPASAQNLVPNWSFEDYTECPTNLSQLENAVAWQRIGGTPDLYNSCGISDTVNVPSSFQGYQQAHSGSGYSGVITYHHDAREFMQVRLDVPLTPGVRAYVSSYVSPGGFANVGQISPELMSSGIGVRMSVDPFPVPDEYIQYYFNSAIVHMATILQDTASWVQLYTDFIPDSAYEYVQIGNFFGEDFTQAVEIDPDGGGLYAYAFVDDVCVSQIEGACNGFDAIGTYASRLPRAMAWFNEVGDLVVDWDGDGTSLNIPVHDVAGSYRSESIVQQPTGRACHHLPLSDNGVFIVTIQNQAQSLEHFKLIRITH